MRKIYLMFCFLFTLLAFGQRVDVQIDLGNNFSVSVQGGIMQPYGTQTSDSGLNVIFLNHQVYSCYHGMNHPFSNSNFIFASYYGSNINGFISDLRNYSLVQKASVCPEIETFDDVLHTTIVNASIGVPAGVDGNGIIVTNDIGLNAIFQNHSVKKYLKECSSCTTGLGSRLYKLMCDDCNVINLKNDLTLYNSVIEGVTYARVAFLLGTDDFKKSNIKVFPNPFTEDFAITSNEEIKLMKIYDVLGKLNIVSSDKKVIQSKSAELSKGIYFFNVELLNGNIGTFKLVKE